MTQAQMYMKELETLNKRSSQALVFSNPNVSQHTRNTALKQYESQLEQLGKRYGLKEVKTETNGILTNYKYEFADGSVHEVKWF